MFSKVLSSDAAEPPRASATLTPRVRFAKFLLFRALSTAPPTSCVETELIDIAQTYMGLAPLRHIAHDLTNFGSSIEILLSSEAMQVPLERSRDAR
jgi:hypothetical protein